MPCNHHEHDDRDEEDRQKREGVRLPRSGLHWPPKFSKLISHVGIEFDLVTAAKNSMVGGGEGGENISRVTPVARPRVPQPPLFWWLASTSF
jgi:hypothetical protein